LLAFAAPRSDGDTTLTFLDHHDLAAAISETDQINYWKPDTVGQFLFNFWD
jgi:hypothetical protein